MNRRAYLAAMGGVGLSGLAGCSMLSSGDDEGSTTPEPTIVDGPAQFTEYKIELPEDATVDTAVSVTVSAFNYGSQAGSVSATLATVEGAETVSKSVDLTDVDSGSRGETTVDLEFSMGDEFVLGVFDTAPSSETATPTGDPMTKATVTVGPEEKPVGEALELGEQLRATLTDVTYQHGVDYTYEDSGFLTSDTKEGTALPASGNVFAVLQFDVENTGTEDVAFDSESFSMDGGTVLPNLNGESMDAATNVEGNPLTDTSVKGGQNVQGWLLTECQQKHAKNGATVKWQRDEHKTTPERAWSVESRDLPSFSLEQWDGIGDQTPGSHTHQITVKNTGGAKGTFYGSLESKRDQDEWELFKQFSADLDAGQSKTFDIQGNYLSVGAVDFRLRPFDKTDTANITAPKLSFGEKATIPNGELRVSDVQTHSSYTQTNEYRDDTKHTPENGDAFLFAYVEFIPDSGDVSDVPDDDPFTARANGTTHSESGYLAGPIGSPIEGEFYTSTNRTQLTAGEPWGGWVSFGVPSDVTDADITVVFQKEYDDGLSKAEWSQG